MCMTYLLICGPLGSWCHVLHQQPPVLLRLRLPGCSALIKNSKKYKNNCIKKTQQTLHVLIACEKWVHNISTIIKNMCLVLLFDHLINSLLFNQALKPSFISTFSTLSKDPSSSHCITFPPSIRSMDTWSSSPLPVSDLSANGRVWWQKMCRVNILYMA